MIILPPPKSVEIARKHLQRERFSPNRSLDDLKGEVESFGIYDESGAKQISENAKNVPRGRLERNIWQQLMAVWQRCSVAVWQFCSTLQCGIVASSAEAWQCCSVSREKW